MARCWLVDATRQPAELDALVREPAELLRRDQVVAFPTETVYGLGANAFSDDAIARVFQAKGRPGDNPLIVHVATREMLREVALDGQVPPVAQKLIDAFWPGPLTVVLKVSPRVSRLCTAGLDSVGVRMPSHPVALALLRVAALPIAAPSANISGRPSPTTAKHVLDDLGARVAGVIDGGGAGVGLESTVVDCTGADQDAVLILRPGGVSRADLLRVVKRVELDPALARRAAASLAPDAAASAPARAPADEDSAAAAAALRPRAPGMKYVHYAPKAPVFLVRGDDALMAALARQRQARGERVGLLATEEAAAGALRGVSEFTVVCGRRSDLESVARGLYAALRAFDELGVDAILAPCLPLDGIGEAIMNRLEKAAAHRVLTAADLAPA